MRKQRTEILYSIIALLGFFISITLFNTSTPITQAAGEITTFAIGEGFEDAIPRQIVRANNDRLYIFAGRKEYTSDIAAYWTTVPGLPSSGADFSGHAIVQDTANPISVEAVYDGNSTIHVLANNNSGILRSKIKRVKFFYFFGSHQKKLRLVIISS